MSALGLAFGALIISAFFAADEMLPTTWSVLLLGSLATFGIVTQSVTRLSMLPRLMIFLYAVCFSVTIGHLIDPYYAWWQTPAAIALIRNEGVSQAMLTVGIVGLLGLLTGIRLAQAFLRKRSHASPESGRTLGLFVFGGAALVAVSLSWIVAPSSTIFVEAYNAGGSAMEAAPMNFNAAGLLSYVLVVLLVIDAERDVTTWRRRVKFVVAVSVTAFIVVVLQVLRGDRECIGLLAALGLLYLTGGQSEELVRRTAAAWRRVRRVAIPLVAVIVLFIVLGVVRSSLARAEDRAAFKLSDRLVGAFQENTWTSILLTNLAQAAQFRNGTAHYLYGGTYVDYLLSLPPGIVTRALGIQRPLESDRGPNWWFVGTSAGGIHIVLVPFRNFGMLGAFGVLMAIGWFVCWVEFRNDRRRFWGRFVYGAVGVVSFFWFWYGDMYLVRILMSVAIFGPAYRFWLKFSRSVNTAIRVGSALAMEGSARRP